MTPTWDVVGVGESSVDHVYHLPSSLTANTKMQVSAPDVRYGGQVATTLATCASLGLRASYVGVFGTDADGAALRTALEQRGLDVAHAPVRPGRHRSAVILVDDRTGDRSVLWSRDPGLALRPVDLDESHVRSARLVHVDSVDAEAAIAAARMARRAGVPVTCDIDTVNTETRELLALVSIPILAEHVPHTLTGQPDIEHAMRQLQPADGGMLCVTLGPRGALLLVGGELHRATGHAVNAVDTTGAGDVFRGAFIEAYLRGVPPPDMLRFANAAAAVSCAKRGALDGVPSRTEIDRLLA